MNHSVQVHDQFVLPGEWRVDFAPARLRTVLGSCVAITLWHPLHHCGGLCHYLLPSRFEKNVADINKAWRYGDEAFAAMSQALQQQSIPIMECEAGIFGGGDMFPSNEEISGVIGLRNIVQAHLLIRDSGAHLITLDVADTISRSIVFDLANGKVLVKRQIKSRARRAE